VPVSRARRETGGPRGRGRPSCRDVQADRPSMCRPNLGWMAAVREHPYYLGAAGQAANDPACWCDFESPASSVTRGLPSSVTIKAR